MNERPRENDPLAPLSKRERMIAERFAEGLTHRQIGNELFIAPSTVRTHIAAVYRKLGIRNKAGLVHVVLGPRISGSLMEHDSVTPQKVEAVSELDQGGALCVSDGPAGQAGTRSPVVRSSRPSLGVLPFETPPGADPREERLASCMTADLISELGRHRSVGVIAKISSFSCPANSVAAREAACELGVSYVLNGHLFADPKRLRVSVQLVDAGTGVQLWSERYIRPLEDVFAARDDTVERIVGTLLGSSGIIKSDAIERARKRSLRELDAFDYVQLARAAFRVSKDGLAEVRALCEKAIVLAPDDPTAHCLLGWANFNSAINGYCDEPALSFAQLHAIAENVVALDARDPAVQLIAGVSYFKQGQRSRGREAWERALTLAPNDPDVLMTVGTNLPYALGVECAAKGIELFHRARWLNPLMPTRELSCLGYICYFAGQYDQAIEALEASGATSQETKVYKALAYGQLGRLADAAREVQAILREAPDFMGRGWIANDIMEPGGSAETLFLDGARKVGLPVE